MHDLKGQCPDYAHAWLLTSVIWYLFPGDENDENSKTGKDEKHTVKIWQALLSFDTRSFTTKAVYTKEHFSFSQLK